MEHEPTRFELSLKRTEKLLNKVQKSFQKVASVAQYDQTMAAYSPALQLAEDTERLTLMTRSLPVYTGVPEAALQVELIKEATIPVQIGFTGNGWFSVRIPALLPRKSRHSSADYVQQYLAPALNRFFRGKEYTIRLEHCVLIYRHVYETAAARNASTVTTTTLRSTEYRPENSAGYGKTPSAGVPL
ncbi:MAG: hypothetical protein MJ077_05260 [Oscillospiraceae bacterium]|nr:hypothetical protein [Oscillospiraceae bacterium]